MQIKICSKCRVSKPLSDFHKFKLRKDGLQIWCKICMKIYQKAYSLTTSGKTIRNESRKRSITKFPEKKAAKNAVHLAIKDNKLKRSAYCEKCGLPAITQAHHADYDKVLSVLWVCQTCHTEIHVS